MFCSHVDGKLGVAFDIKQCIILRNQISYNQIPEGWSEYKKTHLDPDLRC